MKAYTDLGQSKKLVEILPVESADNYYAWHDERYYVVNKDCPYPYSIKEKISCWSLAALRSLLPSAIEFNGETYLFDSYNTSDKIWVYQYAALNESTLFYFKSTHDVDACYEMIICLHEQKYL